MRQKMTHEQRWLTIAEAFATPPKKRTPKQTEVACRGLCWAAVCLGADDVYDDVYDISSIGQFHEWPYGRRDNLRFTMACFFAAMSEKDFKRLLEGK